MAATDYSQGAIVVGGASCWVVSFQVRSAAAAAAVGGAVPGSGGDCRANQPDWQPEASLYRLFSVPACPAAAAALEHPLQGMPAGHL